MSKEVKRKEKPPTQPPVVKKTLVISEPFLDKQNFILIAAGALLMGLGFILMSGGHNNDPSFFNAEELYSTRRMVVAPITIIIGVLVVVFGIFKK